MSAEQRARAALADGRPVVAAAAVAALLVELDTARAALANLTGAMARATKALAPPRSLADVDDQPPNPRHQLVSHPTTCLACRHAWTHHDIPEPGPRRWVCEVQDCDCGRTA